MLVDDLVIDLLKPNMPTNMNKVKQALLFCRCLRSIRNKFLSGLSYDAIDAEIINGIDFVDPAIGIAVKILDGNDRALFPVVIEVLRQLGLLNGMDISRLQPFISPAIHNHRGLQTGQIRAEFELKSV